MISTSRLCPASLRGLYGQTQKMHTLIARDSTPRAQQVDVLRLRPPHPPRLPAGERVNDPIAMYLADLCADPANFARVP